MRRRYVSLLKTPSGPYGGRPAAPFMWAVSTWMFSEAGGLCDRG
jgi:hypothetical protein